MEVGPDLVLAAGAGVAGHERHRRPVGRPPPPQHLEVGVRGKPPLRHVHAHLHPAGSGEGERRLDREAVPGGVALHERQVGLRHPPGGEGGLEGPGVLRGAAAGHEPGGLPVEPVGRVHLARRVGRLGERGEGVLGVARGGVHRQAGRLVDDEETGVVEDHPEDHGGLRLRVGVLQDREAHPGGDPGGWLQPGRPLVLDAGLDEPLDALPGEAPDLLLEVAVEPPPGVVRLNREGDAHDRHGGGTYSPGGGPGSARHCRSSMSCRTRPAFSRGGR